VEGKGKATGMLGAMCLQSSCGRVKVDCGTGYTDAQRKHLWEERNSLHGSVVTVKANDLLNKEGSSVLSLFLPVFIELRDKTEADSLERIEQIFNAAKHIA
jgi:DNA ligase-1